MKPIVLFNKQITHFLPLVIIVFSFLVGSLFASRDNDHFLKNLEPYPDGLLYALSAKNLAEGKGLKLIVEDATVIPWVPPLYSLVLTPSYFLLAQPDSFYLSNILLIVSTIVVIYLGVYSYGRSILVATASTILFISQAVIWWLPSVPMSENLVLLGFSLAVVSLIQKPTPRWLGLTLAGILILFLTKFSVIPLAGLLFVIFVRNIFIYKSIPQRIKVLTLSLIIFLGLFALILTKMTGIFDFQTMVVNFLKQIVGGGSKYYSFAYLSNNLKFYAGTLLGLPRNILWHNLATTSIVLASLTIFATFYNFAKGDEASKVSTIILLLATIGALPLLLIFYIPDGRHLLMLSATYPMIVGMFLYQLLKQKGWQTNYRRFLAGFGLVTIVLIIASQLSWWKYLIASNVLGRSTGWQYTAITEFNKHLSEGEAIVTSLPPVLVEAYKTSNYRSLPLSVHQEFIASGRNLWGSDVDLTDPIKQFGQWLVDGQTLYISNAYVTHQQSVIADFELYKEKFNLILVSEGCLNACNIYKLELKN